ncbi:hypothetical protein [Lysobacter gummosus]
MRRRCELSDDTRRLPSRDRSGRHPSARPARRCAGRQPRRPPVAFHRR